MTHDRGRLARMSDIVVLSATRTAIGTSHKGSLRETPAETLATIVVGESVRRAGVAADQVDDIVLAESLAGGGVLARYAAVANGMTHVPGHAVNHHCAGGLTAVGVAAAQIAAGMANVVVAGGVHSFSMAPELTWRVPGSDRPRTGMAPTFPHTESANDDVTIGVGWNTAQEAGITRDEMDAWALRSHQRATAAIDNRTFADEIVPVPGIDRGGAAISFAVDEHPRQNTSLQTLTALAPLHPEIPGFSITAGNASGINDAAAALVLATPEVADATGGTPLARVRAWQSVGVEPHRTGFGALDAISKILDRTGLTVADIDLWEINEAFASVPVAACRLLKIEEERVNVHGSGCSLGHPIAASGARMLTTLIHELRRRGGGTGIASMCAGGGMGGAVIVDVE